MGDIHDLQLRKIEIAWEIASEAAKRGDGRTIKLSPQDYMEAIDKRLQDAWRIVNQTLPTTPSD